MALGLCCVQNDLFTFILLLLHHPSYRQTKKITVFTVMHCITIKKNRLVWGIRTAVTGSRESRNEAFIYKGMYAEWNRLSWRVKLKRVCVGASCVSWVRLWSMEDPSTHLLNLLKLRLSWMPADRWVVEIMLCARSKYNTRHSQVNTLSSQCHYLSNRQKNMALIGRRYLYRDWIVKKAVLWVIVND